MRVAEDGHGVEGLAYGSAVMQIGHFGAGGERRDHGASYDKALILVGRLIHTEPQRSA